jgi:UDP-glucose 4-epimerase
MIQLKNKTILITGAAGLVGSAMIEELLKHQVERIIGVDNFILGTKKHIEEFLEEIVFYELDVSLPKWHKKIKEKKIDICIHLAANSDISLGCKDPSVDFQRTLSTTFYSLLACLELEVKDFIFASTSAVYGETKIFPTPEECAPMYPVSNYGAAKLASENYISAFVNNYGLNAWIYRFGNVVGKKLTHGVIYDFVRKLHQNPNRLEVLGNGKQTKTYIDVYDCVSGILHGYVFTKPKSTGQHLERFHVFNLSTQGATSVREIANFVVELMGTKETKIIYGEEAIGWIGDVPKTLLDVSRIKAIGWNPRKTSTEAVYDSIKEHIEWSKKSGFLV